MADRRSSEPVQEFRLEGLGLLLGGGLLLAALVGAFYVGRWVERRSHPTGPLAMDGPSPLAQVVSPEEPADADQGLTHFDDLQGEQKQLEPEREARKTPRAATPAKTETPARTQPREEAGEARKGSGPHFVQVFAGRDRHAAELLISKLKQAGYTVRLLSEKEGQGALYKVRVGGYETEASARSVAAKLKDAGYPGAWWVPPSG